MKSSNNRRKSLDLLPLSDLILFGKNTKRIFRTIWLGIPVTAKILHRVESQTMLLADFLLCELLCEVSLTVKQIFTFSLPNLLNPYLLIRSSNGATQCQIAECHSNRIRYDFLKLSIFLGFLVWTNIMSISVNGI